MSKKTGNAVQDDKLTNEELGALYRRVLEISRRLNDGTIKYTSVMGGLQEIIEGQGAEDRSVWNWKTIEIGTYKDMESLRKALEEAGAAIRGQASDVLNRVYLSKSKQSLDLVVLSVKELGFSQRAQLESIHKIGDVQGLGKPPAEAAPQYLLEHGNNLKPGEVLIFAMEPIIDSFCDPRLFFVKRFGDVLSLGAFRVRPDDFWDVDDRFVFVRVRRK